MTVSLVAGVLGMCNLCPLFVSGTDVRLVSSVLGIMCGIIAIIGGVIAVNNREKNGRMVRQSIIENHVDPETAKILVKPLDSKKDKRYSPLVWGCVLIGMGLGYVATMLLGIEDRGFWIILAVGIGLGLLVAFYIRRCLEKKEPKEQSEEK